AMAARDADGAALADDGQEAVWLLIGAAWPLLQDGSHERLRELAAGGGHGERGLDEAAEMARQMLTDLGLESAPTLAEVPR
ncbi:MAG: hypothetical protein ACRDKY_11280, partial [Solirubrobacteraceae bacterium]